MEEAWSGSFSLPDDDGGNGSCEAKDPDKDRQEHANELPIGVALPDGALRLWRRHGSKPCRVCEGEPKVIVG